MLPGVRVRKYVVERKFPTNLEEHVILSHCRWLTYSSVTLHNPFFLRQSHYCANFLFAMRSNDNVVQISEALIRQKTSLHMVLFLLIVGPFLHEKSLFLRNSELSTRFTKTTEESSHDQTMIFFTKFLERKPFYTPCISSNRTIIAWTVDEERKKISHSPRYIRQQEDSQQDHIGKHFYNDFTIEFASDMTLKERYQHREQRKTKSKSISNPSS